VCVCVCIYIYIYIYLYIILIITIKKEEGRIRKSEWKRRKREEIRDLRMKEKKDRETYRNTEK